MRGFERVVRWSAVAAVLALASIAGGCASSGALGGGGNINAPPNYRQAIAAKLRQWEPDVRSAEITKPHNRFVSIVYGGSRPAVCVKLLAPSMFGNLVTSYYLFVFDNGNVDGYKQMAGSHLESQLIGCQGEPLTKFSELKA